MLITGSSYMNDNVTIDVVRYSGRSLRLRGTLRGSSHSYVGVSQRLGSYGIGQDWSVWGRDRNTKPKGKGERKQTNEDGRVPAESNVISGSGSGLRDGVQGGAAAQELDDQQKSICTNNATGWLKYPEMGMGMLDSVDGYASFGRGFAADSSDASTRVKIIRTQPMGGISSKNKSD